jgi:hypothetical protein
MIAITHNPAVAGRPRFRVCTKGPTHWFVERLTTHGWEPVLEEYDAGPLHGYRVKPMLRKTELGCEDWIDDLLTAYDAERARDAQIAAHVAAHPPREYPAQ